MAKDKKKTLDSDTNTTTNNFKKFPKKITNKNKTKKYELFNTVSETGDSKQITIHVCADCKSKLE